MTPGDGSAPSGRSSSSSSRARRPLSRSRPWAPGPASALPSRSTRARPPDRPGRAPGRASRRCSRASSSRRRSRGAAGRSSTSTGETVNVLVSDSFAPDAVTPEKLGRVPREAHARARARVAHDLHRAARRDPHLLRRGALGCYSRNRWSRSARPCPTARPRRRSSATSTGTTSRSTARTRPGSAIDWGPKNWASAAGHLCACGRNEAFPGNEARALRAEPRRGLGRDVPAHGRAESRYHDGDVADHRAELLSDAKPRSSRPSATSLQPWTAGTQSVLRKSVAKRQDLVDPARDAARRRARRHRDGCPRGGLHEVALVAGEPADRAPARAVAGAARAPHHDHRLRPALPLRPGDAEREAGTRDRRRRDAVARAML